jgi:hypothetical protein
MTNFSKLMSVLIFLLPVPSRANAANPASIKGDGWSVNIDIDDSTLTIATAKPGTVLQDVHLNLQSAVMQNESR